MPYALERHKDGSYAVKNIKTGYYHAKHTTKSKAEAQIRLLKMLDKK